MKPKKISPGDLFYHAVHGLCRVDQVMKEDPKNPSYSLVPKAPTKTKVRFVIRASDLEISGFHELISLKEANKILDYLKAGDLKANSNGDQTWGLAKAILTSSQEPIDSKDARKRQIVERSARGLVGELAFVMKMSLKDVATNIQKSLGNPSKISPLVVAALSHASED